MNHPCCARVSCDAPADCLVTAIFRTSRKREALCREHAERMDALVTSGRASALYREPLNREAPRTGARFRLALVRDAEAPESGEPMQTPELAARWFTALLADEPAECMAVAFLDVRNRLIGCAIPYRGTLLHAAVEPRGILVPALLANAASVIIAHNHPSGDPLPSAQDVVVTRRISEAGEIVGVRLADHIILGDGGRWVSLRQRGAMEAAS